MLIKKINYEVMSNIASPFQPWLTTMPHFQEKFQKLHPLSIKSQANFSQFTVETMIEDTIHFVPDNTRIFIFELNESSPMAFYRKINNTGFDFRLKAHTTYFIVRLVSTFGIKGWKVSSKDNFDQLSLDEVIGSEFLLDQIVEADTFEQRISVFSDYFITNWVDSDYSLSTEELMAILLFQNNSNIKMTDLEEILGYSSRYCSKKFKESYGVAPQQYAKVFRFQKVLRMLLNKEREYSLLEIVNATHYFDEAHLSRDFKKYIGVAPIILKDQYQNIITCPKLERIRSY